jgi:DNA-directed RNA polymerase specialized sigma24 family protein
MSGADAVPDSSRFINQASEKTLCDQWRAGNQDAATELYRRFMDRLLTVLSRNLATRFLRRIDPESVMISAFDSLLKRTKEKPFSFEEDSDVWKTLVTIGLNKLRNRVRDAKVQKADINREVYAAGDYDGQIAEILATNPGETDAIVFADLLETLLQRLSPSDREILSLRLEGLSPQEIGGRLTERLTSRSVNRRLSGPIAEAVRSLND